MAQLLLNGLIAGAVYGLMALGFALVFRTLGIFHFAHGGAFVLGAFVAFETASALPTAAAVLAAGAVGGAYGAVVERVAYRPLRHRRAPQLAYLLVSFGAFVFTQNAVLLGWGPDLRSLHRGLAVEGLRVGSARITMLQVGIIATTLIAYVCAALLLSRTAVGRSVRAVADDPLAAVLVGIPVDRVALQVMAVASALAGVAGMLVGLETGLEPTMGLGAVLKAMIAAVVGGLGSLYGAIVGGLLLGVVENLGIWWLPSIWKDAISFAVLLIMLFIRPTGLFGSAVRTRLEG